MQPCLFCSGDASAPDHRDRCDGRQGHQEAVAAGPPTCTRFDGVTFEPALDEVRLGAQCQRVFTAMQDGAWRTLAEISQLTRDPEASISARLRDFRKNRFGAHDVERRRRGVAEFGHWEYRLIPRAKEFRESA